MKRTNACTPILRLLPAIAAVALAFGLSAGSARAQSSPIDGTFQFDESASDDIEQAIVDATGEMNFLIRGFARRRLMRTNVPYGTVAISTGDGRVAITTDDRDPIVRTAGDEPQPWTRPEDGDEMEVGLAWNDGRLHETFYAEDGRRENRFTLAPDGETLRMHVTVTSDRLPEPVTYTLVYTRRP